VHAHHTAPLRPVIAFEKACRQSDGVFGGFFAQNDIVEVRPDVPVRIRDQNCFEILSVLSTVECRRPGARFRGAAGQEAISRIWRSATAAPLPALLALDDKNQHFPLDNTHMFVINWK